MFLIKFNIPDFVKFYLIHYNEFSFISEYDIPWVFSRLDSDNDLYQKYDGGIMLPKYIGMEEEEDDNDIR